MSRAIPLLLLWAFGACSRVNFPSVMERLMGELTLVGYACLLQSASYVEINMEF
jgi:hypothetical protein